MPEDNYWYVCDDCCLPKEEDTTDLDSGGSDLGSDSDDGGTSGSNH